MKKMVNLTPHAINIADELGFTVKVIPPSGTVARVRADQQKVDAIDGIAVVKSVFEPVEGLPEPQEDIVYIVSSLVASQVTERNDVVAPDTGPTCVRDADGRIAAVRRFQRF